MLLCRSAFGDPKLWEFFGFRASSGIMRPSLSPTHWLTVPGQTERVYKLLQWTLTILASDAEAPNTRPGGRAYPKGWVQPLG